ncbi:MAG: class I SAM-dependent methyltransferase [Pseudomonadota bacterium]
MAELTLDTSDDIDWPVEDCACPLCGSNDARPTRYAQAPFAVKRCGECAHWFLSPRLVPEAADRFYTSDQYFNGQSGSGYENYATQKRSLQATFERFVKAIAARGGAGGDLLEVGSGPGYLLDVAKPYFASVEGVELSEATAREAEALSGARIYRSVDEIDAAKTYDCIVATHVIEHIYEPVSFTRDLVERLRPGGLMFLAAPHMNSPLRYLMGRAWPSWKYPEHVSFFDQKTLPDLMRRSGLTDPQLVPYPHAFPLPLILSKFGLGAPRWSERINLTLPTTTVCVMARKAKA